MTETRDFNVTNAWSEVNPLEDLSSAIVQLKGDGPVHVTVGVRAPSAGATDGFVLHKGGLMELPVPNMGVGDKIFLRSTQDEVNLVCALLVISGPSGG